jgi:hypothetical protein
LQHPAKFPSVAVVVHQRRALEHPAEVFPKLLEHVGVVADLHRLLDELALVPVDKRLQPEALVLQHTLP